MGQSAKRILIVDDEADIREILKDLLEDLGEVVCVQDGASALKELELRSFDLMVSDYNMPGINGMDLLKAINERGVPISVIWITGRSTPKLFENAWAEGVFDYIEKPFDLDEVRKSVVTCLSVNHKS